MVDKSLLCVFIIVNVLRLAGKVAKTLSKLDFAMTEFVLSSGPIKVSSSKFTICAKKLAIFEWDTFFSWTLNREILANCGKVLNSNRLTMFAKNVVTIKLATR